MIMRTDKSVTQIPVCKRNIIVQPIGSCEQHGPYLPLDTDLRIIELIADKLDQRFSDNSLLKLPAIPFSCSWEHKGSGMISLSVGTLANVIHDIARSLKTWNTQFVLVLLNWHGGNSMLGSLADEITAEYGIPTATFNTLSEATRIWNATFGSSSHDIHAGMIETSIVQAYWPELIREKLSPEANCEPDISPLSIQSAIQALGITSLTTQGIWGTPSLADTPKGTLIIDNLVGKVYEQIRKLVQIVEQH